MMRIGSRLLVHGVALAALALAGPVSAQGSSPAAPLKKGTVQKVSVHGAALQGNLEGDSPDRDVYVLPSPELRDQPQSAIPGRLIVAKWAANSPLAMIDQYVTNLKKYRAIAGEVGLQDGLAAANTQMAHLFTDLGVPHTFETYEGDHTNRVIERIEQKVLPFFSNNLSFK